MQKERDLLHDKIQAVFEGDSHSFNLKLYCLDGEIPLESPTKTMALVLSFVEHNNKLLSQINELEGHIAEMKNRSEGKEATEKSLQTELTQCQERNCKLIEALSKANELSQQSDRDLQELKEECSLMKNKMMALTRENQLMKLRNSNL